MKDYYRLLEIAPTATADEVKRAFRLQIARYHPDKVQHLGQEFQAMAAERAADLTGLTLIPVDARNWEAHMPLDAPAIAKTLLARLRTGA
mgnify:CR=1 FL=1